MNRGLEYYTLFLNGDNESFAELVSLYNERLILFIFGIVKDFATAEDLAADTFVKLLVKKPAFKQESGFKSWLFRIARNLSIDYLRHQQKQVFVSLDEAEQSFFQYCQNAEQTVIQEETNKNIHAILLRLPDQYRSVLSLLYFEDMNYKQVAKIMRWSEKKVKNTAYNARKAAKELMIKEGIEYEIK